MYMHPRVTTVAFQVRKGLWGGFSPYTAHFRDPFPIPLVLLETSHAHIGVLEMGMDGYG